MAEFDQIPKIALDWIKTGHKVALATVIETWGSAPRPVGAELVITADGEFEGSVSGGCVEGAVVIEAQEALVDGRARLLEYGVSDDAAFAVGLACGGTIKVLVDPIGIARGPDADILAARVQAFQGRVAIATLVNTRTWQRALSGDPALPAPLAEAVRARLASGKSGMEGDWFITIQTPPLRLYIIGAVHIAQALLPMAQLAGFAPILVDPRGAFARASRFPDVDIREDWPDEVLHAAHLDAHSAVVTLSHDPKIDDPAILETLKSPAFYLGCLGSRKTHAKRLLRLRAAGVSETDIARIHAPIGLDIGAKSPAEIAASVLADLIQTLRRPPAV